jgi:hypothetical protein
MEIRWLETLSQRETEVLFDELLSNNDFCLEYWNFIPEWPCFFAEEVN